jgi:hypothetical protein
MADFSEIIRLQGIHADFTLDIRSTYLFDYMIVRQPQFFTPTVIVQLAGMLIDTYNIKSNYTRDHQNIIVYHLGDKMEDTIELIDPDRRMTVIEIAIMYYLGRGNIDKCLSIIKKYKVYRFIKDVYEKYPTFEVTDKIIDILPDRCYSTEYWHREFGVLHMMEATISFGSERKLKERGFI